MVMTDMHNGIDGIDALEGVFAAARQTAPEPSAAFLMRVMAEAEAVQAARQAAAARPAARGGRLAGLMALVGGWPALGGMVAAAATGLWIGFIGGERIDGFTAVYLGASDSASAVSLLPEGDLFALME